MISDQEIRAQAAQTAATVAATVGLGDATGFLKVASMIETYISTGAEAAQKIVDSWSTSAPPTKEASPRAPHIVAPDGDSPRSVSAQELADAAYRAENRGQLKEIIDMAKKEKVGGQKVTVEKVSGPLGDYLNRRWSALASTAPLHERNKGPQDVESSMRSELGL